MGEVYLVQHPRLPRKDALKVLATELSADEQYRARFGREADLASTLYHPHIVGVHDRGEYDGQLWISMDYVEGRDAARLLADDYPDGMPPHRVTKIINAVAQALDYAHERGMLHRDVKPANVILSDDEKRILLTDFGIARSLSEGASLTATGFTVGTVAYAAPEQLMGEDLDGRADQYALAATAFHLFTGVQLFSHSNAAVVIGRHLNSPPPMLAEVRPSLSALDQVLSVALAKSPSDRFADCADFARALALAGVRANTDRHRGGGPSRPQSSATQAWFTATPDGAIDHATAAATPPTQPRASTQRPPRTLKAAMPVATTTPPATIGTTHNYRVWPIALGAIAVTAVIAVALFVFWPWQQDRNHGHTDAPTASTPPTSFDSMKDFVTAYYAALPDHAADAWTRLDPHCQEQTGQAAFLSFWATIQSVTVVSISPRDATSVTARLTYVRKNGKVDAEDRWLRMSSANGLLQLNESERISPVAAPTNTTPTSTGPAATQVINAAAVVNGQPANGYSEGQSPSNGNDVFGCDTSPAAVDDGIYRCAPSAADADVCWPSTSPTLLCVDNPFDQIVYRVTYTDPLPFTQKPTEPSPFALLLDDGTRCRLRNGGAWGGRDDGLSGAYYCLSDKRVVLEGETTPAPDRSQSLWTVKLGEIGGGNEHFPPPETHTVIKAWFASN